MCEGICRSEKERVSAGVGTPRDKYLELGGRGLEGGETDGGPGSVISEVAVVVNS